MSVVISPSMSLPVPVVGGENGPQFAIDINNCMSIIDGHNHSPGSGVQITPAGLNINSTLTFRNNAATNLASAGFTAGSLLTSIGTLYVNGVDLYYTDINGNQIQITKAGIVNTIASSIPGESYSAGTFTWVQGSGSTTPANFDIGSVTIRPNTAGTTNGVIVSPPSAIASQYQIFLPPIPGASAFLTIDTGGNISGSVPTVSGISGANIASGTITGSNIATATVIGSNIASATITNSNLSPPPGSISSSCNNATIVVSGVSNADVTNLSVTFTASGNRPIFIGLIPDGSTNIPSTSNYPNNTYLRYMKDGSFFAMAAQVQASGDIVLISTIDFSPTAGPHTYKLNFNHTASGVVSILINYYKLAVFEL